MQTAQEHISTDTHQSCYHCGDSCRSHAVEFDSHVFCCDGCKAVYGILKENNLCNYYNIEQNPGNSLKNKINESKYAFLDEPDVANRLLDFRSDTLHKVSFYVPGIHCSSCIWLLENLHRMDKGIISSRIDFLKKQVSVAYIPTETSLKKVVQLMANVGYEPLLSLSDVVKKSDEVQSRRLIKKIAVAGFCSSNIMLLSLGEYFGFDVYSKAFFGSLFGYLNIVLSIPVIFYAASDYFVSAWRGISKKMLNLDVPIALGMGVLFVRSVYEVLMHIGPGYFDSFTGLVFFLLIGKWFQAKTYEAMSFDRDYTSYFPLAVTVKNNNEFKVVAVNKLKKGDRMVIRHQELIPTDAILLRGEGYIDYSFVTGESNTVPKIMGEMVYAGGRQVGGNIELEVMKEVSQSYLTQLWNNEAFKKGEKSRLQTFSDAVGKYFTMATIVASGATYVTWYFINPDKALFVFISVLLVACPCALALSAPFALGNIMRIFGNNKLYLKNAEVIEELSACDTVVFDKTGTITSTEESIIHYTGVELDDAEKILVASATHNSSHPLSRLLAAHLESYRRDVVDSFTEHPGKGLEAAGLGKTLKLGNANFTKYSPRNNEFTLTRVFVCVNGDVKGYYSFANKYRDSISSLSDSLSADNYTLYLLSGDHDGERPTLNNLFKNKAKMLFEQNPTEKLAFIKSLQEKGNKVIMIGDGLNDAGALKQSNVGIAVTEDVTHFSPSCDAILDASAFGKLPLFMEMSKKTMSVIRWSFALSLVYNFITLSFAVTGILTPLVAAIVMPLSSITVVVFAVTGTNYIAKKGGLI